MPAIPIVIRRVATNKCRHIGALIFCFILWLCFPLSSYAVSQSVLTGIQVTTAANSNSPQVSLSFNNSVDYKLFTLPNPNRLVVDLKYCRAGIKTNQVDISNSPIAKVRIGIQNGVNLRVVFDLTQAVHPNSMPSNNASGERLDIVLSGGAAGNTSSSANLGNTSGAQMSAAPAGTGTEAEANSENNSAQQMSAASANASTSVGNDETVRTSSAVRSADISRVEQMSIEADLNYQVGSTTVAKNQASATRENGTPNNGISTSANETTNNTINNPNMNSNRMGNSNVTASENSNQMGRSNVTTSESSNPSATVVTTSANGEGNITNNNVGNVTNDSSNDLKNNNYTNNINADSNDAENNNHNDVDADDDGTNHFYTSRLTHTIFSSATISDRPVIVVIDPGHGGKDPGATGPMGLHEKTVTLEIAEDLKHLIDKQEGMRAVLTRTGDYYVGLRDRLAIARKDKGDMFIAIHADAAPAISGYEATGATVYALSLHGASSEAARWIAEKENYSELGGIDLDTIQDSDNMLRSVLIDLSQTATISDSLILGRSVLHQLSDLSPLHHDVVEQAPFMVLKSPDIPSILIETGYITNPQEETHLRDPLYQEELAHAMLSGINNYFMHYAPPGSWLASNHEALKGKDTRNI